MSVKETSNYCSNEYTAFIESLKLSVENYNALVQMVDSEIEENADSSCSNCDYKRRYGQ